MLNDTRQEEPMLRHLWLEVTGRCNLQCAHCYADSGPARGHGTMSRDDWLRVIDEAEDLGVTTIQFIGGEPTLHPDFLQLIEHAAATDRAVEVYSNMARVRDEHWSKYKELGISLATSFYSADPSAHDSVTGRGGSQSRTLRNIELAVAQGIPIRVAIISKQGGDDGEGETANLLAQAGVEHITWDRVRGVGRGATLEAEAQLDALCGNCTASSAAVDPYGNVFPCVFARAMNGGNVHLACLADVISGSAMQGRISVLRDHFAGKSFPLRAQCTPCGPDACNPNTPPPKCQPLESWKPYDPGRPPEKVPFEKLPLKEKIPAREKAPKINPGKSQIH